MGLDSLRVPFRCVHRGLGWHQFGTVLWYRHRLYIPTVPRDEVNAEPPQVAVSRVDGSPIRRDRGVQLALSNARRVDIGP